MRLEERWKESTGINFCLLALERMGALPAEDHQLLVGSWMGEIVMRNGKREWKTGLQDFLRHQWPCS